MKSEYKSNIIKAYIFKFLRNSHFFSGVLIPFFTIWGGITFAQVMVLQAIFTFSMFIFEIPTGVVADKWGRKTSLVLSGIITAIAAIVYASRPVFWVFALGEILWAIGGTLVSGADSAIIYDSLKKTREEKKSKKIFGRFDSIGLVAILIIAPIGSIIAKYFGLRTTMFLTAVPMILSTCVALSFKEPRIKKKREKRESYMKILKRGIRYFKDHKELKIITFDYISITVLTFFLIWVYQIILQNFGVSIKWFGFIHSGIVLIEIIVLNNFVHLEKMFGGKRKYLFLTSLICGFSFLLMAFSKNIYLTMTGFGLIAGFGLTRKPLFKSYMNKFIKSDTRATVLSTISMIYSLTIAITNIILGYLVDWNIKYALIIIGTLIILFTLISKVKEEHLLD